jgi:ADP-ribose pyrophosphatase YjhB (NUDIX family)
MRVRVAGLLRVSGSILLVEHEKAGRAYWLLPGGGVHAGERAADALRRELREELSVDCEVKELLFVVEAIGDGGKHLIQSTYEIEVPDMTGLRIGGDRRVRRYGFFGAGELEPLAVYPDIKSELRGFLKKGTLGDRYLLKRWIE